MLTKTYEILGDKTHALPTLTLQPSWDKQALLD